MNDLAVDPRVLGPVPAELRLLRFAVDELTPSEVPQEVAQETRQIAFSDFVREAWHVVEPATEYLHNWHIDAIGVFLEKIEAGDITRAVINIPPRSMKSLLVRVLWPCWIWTRKPGTKFLFGSYDSTLSRMHNVLCRAVIESPWYREHWGHIVKLLHDTNRQDEFANTARGHMIATSVGGSATGKGADIIVIDDPLDPQGAVSDAERETASKWVSQTMQNRLNSDRGKIVLVMQRVHEEDPAGQAIAQGYRLLKIPAIEERPKDGEPQAVYEMPGGRFVRRKIGTVLWPQRYGLAYLRALEVTMGVGFYGQFQQTPTGAKGHVFDVSALRKWQEFAPGHSEYERRVIARVRYWDAAATEDGGDWTVGLRMALLVDGRFVIEDVYREQLEPDEVDKAIRLLSDVDQQLCVRHGIPYAVREEQEGGSSGKSVVRLRARRQMIGFDYQGIPSHKSKVIRAQPLASSIRMGLVYLLPAQWNAAFIEELRVFNRGKHDDQVDGASGAHNHLAEMVVNGTVEVGVAK